MLLHGGELFLHKFGLMGEGGASSAGALLLAFTRRSAITFSTRPASPLTLPMAARWSMLRKWRRTKAPARPNSTTGRKSGSRRTRWSGSDCDIQSWIPMCNRDEFSEDTKRKVALRASHRCSFPGCSQITAGPSDESSAAVNMIGKAAHIHAAAPGPGARRYLASMSREERSHITNAIWLCATHADLIDRDEVTYTADVLRTMKSEHEANCAARQRSAILAGEFIPDLIAIGPDIVFVGEFLASIVMSGAFICGASSTATLTPSSRSPNDAIKPQPLMAMFS